MPYFYNKNINLNCLFLHIPKTGGTSIENYFSSYFKVKLDEKSLFTPYGESIKKYGINNVSLQHQTYSTIMKHKDELNIDLDNLVILTICRNPYERLVSDLFFYRLIKKTSTPEEVYNIIKNNYLDKPYYDNHNIPQYKFIIDETTNKVVPNVTILAQETLTEDMHNIGFPKFNFHDLKNQNGKLNYYDYLNRESIDLINEYYKKDFYFFNYEMI